MITAVLILTLYTSCGLAFTVALLAAWGKQPGVSGHLRTAHRMAWYRLTMRRRMPRYKGGREPDIRLTDEELTGFTAFMIGWRERAIFADEPQRRRP